MLSPGPLQSSAREGSEHAGQVHLMELTVKTTVVTVLTQLLRWLPTLVFSCVGYPTDMG